METAIRKTAEMFKLGGRYDRDLTPRHFAFGGLGFEHDRLQQLDLRTSLNAGVGYHVLADEGHTFDLFGGLGASSERYETLTRDFAEAVLGEESAHKITADTSLRQRLAFYPNLEDAGEYRAEFEATLATALAAGWTFNVTLSNRYVSNPLPGLENTDTQLFVGVGGKFGPK